MLLGYNTNGLAHHEPIAAIELLAELGYQSVAIALDHVWLNPFADNLGGQMRAIRSALHKHQLRSVIETGARYLLDPRVKHEPTLVSPDAAERARRVRFLMRAVDIASDLGSACVSLWSGVLHDKAPEDVAWSRLLPRLHAVLDYADGKGVPLGFEPEPGMFIDTMARFAELVDRLADPRLCLTLDVGHLHCQRETPIAEHVRRWAPMLVNVHVEDMRAGVHEHLQFGEGEIDFPPVIAALADSGYAGPVHVELSRHSHDAPRAARRAIEFLRPLLVK